MKLSKSLTFILICFAMTSKSQKGVIDTTVFSEFDTLSYFYKIKPGYNLYGNDAVDKIKAYYGLNSNHSFTEYKNKTDGANHSHQKYQHYFNKLPVYGSLLYIHSYESADVYMVNGFIASVFDSKASVNIDAAGAIDLAKDQVKASKYLWEDEGMENQLKIEENDENATYYPTTELFYYPVNGYKSTYTIAYKVLINSMEPFSKEYLWIDATNGDVIGRYSALESCKPPAENKTEHTSQLPAPPSCNGDCYSGTTSTLYYGDQYVNIGKHQFGPDCKYRLLDGCNNTVIHTISTIQVSSNSSSGVYEYTDQTNYFSFGATKPGGTAHWGAEMATEYYRNTFSREGMNGAGTGSNPFYFTVRCNVDGTPSNNTQDNASYDAATDNLNFGSGGNGLAAQDVVCVDVVGHEYTHGVSRYEANFSATGEPAALNESFSDIFGTMVEYYAKSNHSTGTSFSYDFGNDAYYHTTYTVDGGGPTIYVDRDMTYPNNSNLPDTYGGTYWLNPAFTGIDAGGRHINCTVQDYWFYLLAEGGSGTNDLGNAFCVRGIGKDKAIRIAYQTLVYYMSTNSNFSSARYGSVSAAGDLYGITSVEYAETIAAWYAVGIGANPVNSNGYYISLGNKTETSSTNYNYNTSLRFDSYIVNPYVAVDISSNNQIDISGVHFNGPFSASYADTQFKSGSEVRLHIGPTACANGSRMSTHGDAAGNEPKNESLKNSDQYGLNIFPNPNAGKFELHLDENLGYPSQIIVMDVFGKEVRKITNPESYLQNIEMTESSSGIYMVNVYYNDKVISKKIVKN